MLRKDLGEETIVLDRCLDFDWEEADMISRERRLKEALQMLLTRHLLETDAPGSVARLLMLD